MCHKNESGDKIDTIAILFGQRLALSKTFWTIVMSWNSHSPYGDVTILFSNLDTSGIGLYLGDGGTLHKAAFWAVPVWLARSRARCRVDRRCNDIFSLT
jgi:hypothetical protein